jgi:N-ethylmaleimide reductase
VGQGYLDIAGLHDDVQQAGWARVADAVRAEGDAKLVIQLMHCGRVAHPVYTGGVTPIAPSALRHEGTVRTPAGDLDYVTPREIATDELAEVRDTYVQAARRAVAAGADGVELHAANGYLLHQFLSSNTNLRTDGYGGDVAGRIRFVTETVDAVADAIGERRVAIASHPATSSTGSRRPTRRRRTTRCCARSPHGTSCTST